MKKIIITLLALVIVCGGFYFYQYNNTKKEVNIFLSNLDNLKKDFKTLESEYDSISINAFSKTGTINNLRLSNKKGIQVSFKKVILPTKKHDILIRDISFNHLFGSLSVKSIDITNFNKLRDFFLSSRILTKDLIVSSAFFKSSIGTDKLALNNDLIMHINPAEGTLKGEMPNLDISNIFTIKGKISLSEIQEKHLTMLAKQTATYESKDDEYDEIKKMKDDVAINSANISYTDKGLFQMFIKYGAKKKGMDIEEFKMKELAKIDRDINRATKKIEEGINKNKYMVERDMLNAFKKMFNGEAKTIKISLSPDKPVKFKEMDKARGKAKDEIFQKLNIKIVSE